MSIINKIERERLKNLIEIVTYNWINEKVYDIPKRDLKEVSLTDRMTLLFLDSLDTDKLMENLLEDELSEEELRNITNEDRLEFIDLIDELSDDIYYIIDDRIKSRREEIEDFE